MEGFIIDPSSTARSILMMELDFPQISWKGLENPKSILELISKNPPEIITTSMEFGNETGIELIYKIRKLRIKQPLIILITSHDDEVFYSKAYDFGADIVYPKSFAKGDLKKILNRVFLMSSRPRKILVVDDSAISRKIMTHNLIKIGYEFQEASSSEEAYEILQESSNEVLMIVSDENMDGMSGSEFCKKIRRDNRMSLIPFFILTADNNINPDNSKNVFLLNGMLTKPVDFNVILELANYYSTNWLSFRNDIRTILPLHLNQTS
ncbi:MAG: response regulator [Leptospira sp.]|nr:response regulator [Leptospira sp.]